MTSIKWNDQTHMDEIVLNSILKHDLTDQFISFDRLFKHECFHNYCIKITV